MASRRSNALATASEYHGRLLRSLQEAIRCPAVDELPPGAPIRFSSVLKEGGGELGQEDPEIPGSCQPAPQLALLRPVP